MIIFYIVFVLDSSYIYFLLNHFLPGHLLWLWRPSLSMYMYTRASPRTVAWMYVFLFSLSLSHIILNQFMPVRNARHFSLYLWTWYISHLLDPGNCITEAFQYRLFTSLVSSQYTSNTYKILVNVVFVLLHSYFCTFSLFLPYLEKTVPICIIHWDHIILYYVPSLFEYVHLN